MGKWNRVKMLQAFELYNPQTFLRVIKVLYDFQTEEERMRLSTEVSNGRGFNKVDAPFMMGMYERAVKRTPQATLTQKEFVTARNIMKKYAGQLCAIANGFR